MFITLASYFFRNLLKLCRLLFKVACSRRSFSSLSSFNELTRVVLGENFRWFMPLFKATENALLSSTVQVIITTKTVKVKDKLSDDFMVLLHDSSKANKLVTILLRCSLICARILIFWCAAIAIYPLLLVRQRASYECLSPVSHIPIVVWKLFLCR